MLNIGQLPCAIVDDLKKRGHTEEAIAEMTPAEAFDEYCMWHGLIGWGKSSKLCSSCHSVTLA